MGLAQATRPGGEADEGGGDGRGSGEDDGGDDVLGRRLGDASSGGDGYFVGTVETVMGRGRARRRPGANWYDDRAGRGGCSCDALNITSG